MNDSIQGLVAALGIGEAELAEFLQRKLDAKKLLDQAAEIDSEIAGLLAKVAELKEKKALLAERANTMSSAANSRFDAKSSVQAPTAEREPDAASREPVQSRPTISARAETAETPPQPEIVQRLEKTSRPAGTDAPPTFDFLSWSSSDAGMFEGMAAGERLVAALAMSPAVRKFPPIPARIPDNHKE